MRKIVLTLAFFCCFLSFATAQLVQNLNLDGELRLGFQLSPTINWMQTDDNAINGNGSNIGMKLGMMSEFYFRENYAFATGINFAFNQGGTLRHEIGGNLWSKSELSNTALRDLPKGTNLKYHIQYLEFPFGLKMRTKEFGYLRYFAEIPTFTLGFKLQARGDVIGTSSLDTKRENIGKDVNLFNISWGFGGGVHYALSETSTLVGGIYFHQGFADVTDNGGQKNDGTKEDSKGILKNITIRFGFLF